jgi:N-acetylglucosaminyl-diphospho-decaprenol L-rhamnosyltransferase
MTEVTYSFSIVSHGQGDLIKNLLSDFEDLCLKNYEILITLNIPENEVFIQAHRSLPIKIIRNTVRKGFGQNHNDAFKASLGKIFVILNPDIRIHNQNLDHLWCCLQQRVVGACAPLVLSPEGEIEDSARTFPSLLTIIKRYLSGTDRKTNNYDYDLSKGQVAVDWTAGMFTAFHRHTFQLVNGFDENYFMYYEDVDICMRIRHAGFTVMLVPEVQVIHAAQRASRKKLSYLRWHFVSALRFATKHFMMKIRHRNQQTF